MNSAQLWEKVVINWLSMSVVIPSAIFCYLPVRDRLRYPLKQIIPFMVIAIFLYCVVGGYLCAQWNILLEAVLLPLLPLLFLAYKATVTVDFFKSLFVFCTAACAMSFASAWATLVTAVLQPGETLLTDYSWWSVGIHSIAVALVFAGLYVPIKKYVRWMVRHFEARMAWRFLWILPVVFTVINVLFRPMEYRYMGNHLLFSSYVFVYIFLPVLLFLCYFMAYKISRSYTLNIALAVENQILMAQGEQVEAIKAHIEETRRIRHDFRQQMRVMDSLLQKQDYESLRAYMADYTQQASLKELPIYCENSAVDALAGYYIRLAEKRDIGMKLELKLPQTLPVSEVDFCILFGNLVENALDGAATAEKNRFVSVRVALNLASCCILVIENSFSGQLKQQGERYLSTKSGGQGIGMTSVEHIVYKYGGTLDIAHDGCLFSVQVILNFP